MFITKKKMEAMIKEAVDAKGQKWSHDYTELAKFLNEQMSKANSEINSKIEAVYKDISAKLGQEMEKIAESLKNANQIIERDNNHLNTTIDEMDSAIKVLRAAHVESNLKLAAAIEKLAGGESKTLTEKKKK